MTDVWERAAKLPPAQRAAFVAHARQAITRRAALNACANPAELAALLDPSYRITPAIRVVAETFEIACTTPDDRKIVTMPPQEGKTHTAVHAGIRALQRNPDTRILYVSYSEELAVRSSRQARNLIAQYGSDARDPLTGLPLPDRLGLSLAADNSAAGSWSIKGHRGGMIGVGIGGTITGRAADLVIIDDPLKGMQAADSPTERRRVIEGYQANIATRLAPGASVIIINTRWSEEDLTGWLLAQDAKRPPGRRRWQLVNIPAVAEQGLPDALGRAPGEWLESARGHRDWDEKRAEHGERVWYALFQGSPTPIGGGLFSQAWFDDHRLAAAPPLYRRVVAIDPAETGKGDEAGIVAAGLAGDGTVVLTDDESGQLSSAQWPRRACLLALATGASEVVFEAYSAPTTYEALLKRAYTDLVAEAAGGTVEGVAVPADRPFLVTPWKATGNGLVRSTGLRNATSVGRCRVVGHRLATLEAHAIRWQEGQHQPDRVAAATIAYDVLSGGGLAVVSPDPGGWGQFPDGLTGR